MTRSCPACEGVPHGQAWLCPLCKGKQRVPESTAIDYCQAQVDEAQGALDRAHAKLRKAIWG